MVKMFSGKIINWFRSPWFFGCGYPDLGIANVSKHEKGKKG